MSEYITDQEKSSNPPIAETENMRVYHIENSLLIDIGPGEGELIVSVPDEFQELRLLLDKAHGQLKALNRKIGDS